MTEGAAGQLRILCLTVCMLLPKALVAGSGAPLGTSSLPYLEPAYTGMTAYVDEDTFMWPTTDQDYTTGFQFTFGGRFAHGVSQPLRAFDWLSRMSRLHDSICTDSDSTCKPRSYKAHSLAVGLTFFTPRKGDAGDPDCVLQEHGCVLALDRPLHNDRPYASILYATVNRSTARGRNAWESEFTVGVLGLDIAKRLQTWFHQGIGHDVTPGGWGFQISNGGEPTLRYGVTWTHLVANGYWHAPPTGVSVDVARPSTRSALETGFDPVPRRWLDLTTDLQANLGFYTNALAGARLRLGYIDSPYWGAQRHPVEFTFKATPPKFREAYVWVGGGGTAWGYNALLQGQFRKSDVTLRFGDSDDPNAAALRRFIWDYQWGGTVRFGDGLGWLGHFSLTYQYMRHAALFTGPHSRVHNWGGVYLGIFPSPKFNLGP
jgi:Outer membrane protein LpxR